MRRCSRGRRPGSTLLELLVALGIAALLGAVLLGLLLVQLRLARATAARAVAADAVRTTAAVLAGEVRRGAAADLRAISPDSLVIRSFRGVGIVCAAAPGVSRVRFSGDRLPDPEKDSVIVIGDNGESAGSALLHSLERPGACAAAEGERILDWTMSGPPASAGLLLLFEPGSYHLTGSALRYRTGSAGRQPLTAESFIDSATSFLPTCCTPSVRYQLGTHELPAVIHTAAFGWRP